ncbi:hypothetical protein E3P99_01170 [Wallemia hederae]|uniref:Aromatic amino acid beta-eliminating lyase/threonine aldolase domain-containing protein n=1 Tax=Wallemia hederae TaxID=1540922 RepID=A0A4T0FU48_9BASI|nr:hypothetical protein E3P99_01170 [Wallemia hederae]
MKAGIIRGIRNYSANATKLQSLSRDFRTDTITAPTDDMLAYAMSNASRGDDVYGEDESTVKFEQKMATLTGKKAAMFCVSGTMSNQLGLRTHLLQPPHSVLCDSHAHIYKYETGGVAFHSQAQVTPVHATNEHHLTLEDIVSEAVLDDDVCSAPTRVVSLENTKNGLVFPQDEAVRISEWAKQHSLIMHLDGARLWNVHAATNTPIDVLCQPFDSVSLCLSKGVGAPIGSILVGSENFIKKARWFRKLFGGGIRQSGFMVECADYALEINLPRLAKTHSQAQTIAKGFQDLGIAILSPVESSMVFFDSSSIGVSLDEFIQYVNTHADITISSNRLVVHHHISDAAVEQLLDAARTLAQQKRSPLASAIGQFGQIYQRRPSK